MARHRTLPRTPMFSCSLLQPVDPQTAESAHTWCGGGGGVGLLTRSLATYEHVEMDTQVLRRRSGWRVGLVRASLAVENPTRIIKDGWLCVRCGWVFLAWRVSCRFVLVVRGKTRKALATTAAAAVVVVMGTRLAASADATAKVCGVRRSARSSPSERRQHGAITPSRTVKARGLLVLPASSRFTPSG